MKCRLRESNPDTVTHPSTSCLVIEFCSVGRFFVAVLWVEGIGSLNRTNRIYMPLNIYLLIIFRCVIMSDSLQVFRRAARILARTEHHAELRPQEIHSASKYTSQTYTSVGILMRCRETKCYNGCTLLRPGGHYNGSV